LPGRPYRPYFGEFVKKSKPPTEYPNLSSLKGLRDEIYYCPKCKKYRRLSSQVLYSDIKNDNCLCPGEAFLDSLEKENL